MNQEIPNDEVHIIFWSKFDEISQTIKNQLIKEPNVRTLCVDNKIINKSILADTNYNVREVPTILTINQNGQDSLTTGDNACKQFVSKLNKQKLLSIQKPSIFDARLKMSSSEIAANPSSTQTKPQSYPDSISSIQQSPNETQTQPYHQTVANTDFNQPSESRKKLSPKELADQMMKERGL